MSWQPDDGKRDGKTKGDIVITGLLTAEVRAERAGGGPGRKYAITVECAAWDDVEQIWQIETATGIVTVPLEE
ncbi:MAG: hypothetical protein VCC99_17720 [Alphaproteobacteria bacterium]